MIREQRISYICSELQQKGIVSIAELTHAMQTSRSTIRRDLSDLEAQGLLKCIWGGAVSLSKQMAYEPPFNTRRDLCVDEKRRIASRAMELVVDNATILLDSGTTSYELAKQLAGSKHINVATNDLNSAMALAANADISLFILGGTLRPNHYSVNGLFTEEMIRQLHADMAFLSVDAINLSSGLMSFSMEEMPTKRMMIQSARRIVVLCDHSKFESLAFVNICPLSSVDIVITGKETPPAILEQLKEQGITVLTA